MISSDDKRDLQSDNINLKLHNHRIVTSVRRSLIRKLININDKISHIAGVQTHIYLTNRGVPQANAFAAYIHNEYIIAINFKMLAILGFDEGMYAALIAHEIAHVVHQDRVNILLNKKQEEQADKLGVKLMLQAGYSSKSAIDFYTLLTTISANNHQLLSSHPSSKYRLQYIQESIVKFPLLRHRNLSGNQKAE